jgi:hypothetical protein
MRRRGASTCCGRCAWSRRRRTGVCAAAALFSNLTLTLHPTPSTPCLIRPQSRAVRARAPFASEADAAARRHRRQPHPRRRFQPIQGETKHRSQRVAASHVAQTAAAPPARPRRRPKHAGRRRAQPAQPLRLSHALRRSPAAPPPAAHLACAALLLLPVLPPRDPQPIAAAAAAIFVIPQTRAFLLAPAHISLALPRRHAAVGSGGARRHKKERHGSGYQRKVSRGIGGMCSHLQRSRGATSGSTSSASSCARCQRLQRFLHCIIVTFIAPRSALTRHRLNNSSPSRAAARRCKPSSGHWQQPKRCPCWTGQ